ncbi:MAG: DUF3667 domain-containing protein [Erythrobacter sp.]
MNGIGEGIGAAVEGGLVGRAIEPAHGEASTRHETSECLNCGAMVSGAYCGQCGQPAHVHRSLTAVGHDIMHGVLHLDGKLWNTLPLLALKPGKLTRRYIEGERAKFVSPMAMFLFSIFAMFAVFQMVGLSVPVDLSEQLNGMNQSPQAKAEITAEIEDLRKKVAELPANDPQRKEAETGLAALQAISGGIAADFGSAGELDFNVTGIRWLDEGILKKWQKNPGLMLYKLQANGYKFSWLLVPLSIPFVWLVFAWRRQFKAYDHAVFVTYSLSFMSLLFIAVSLLATLGVGAGWIAAILLIAMPLHLYKQLRYAYGLTRLSALWRFFVLLVFMQIVLVLFLQALLALGAF